MGSVLGVEPWDEVVGQPGAVAFLRGAAADPVHAYLLVGPSGTGKRAAARAFAADVLADGAADPERVRRLCAAENHPDLIVVERTGASIDVETARRVGRLAVRPPVEADRKVLVLVDFHLVRQAGPALLKTIEEPSATTVFVVLADEIPSELVTIASRCVQVPFGPIPAADVVAALVADGVDEATARVAADAAGGDLRRARLLTTDPELGARAEAWRTVPDRLDGSGHRALTIADELLGLLDAAAGPVQAAQVAELERWREERETQGLPTSVPKELADRHKRELRRARTDELRSGLRTLAGRYRADLLDGGDPARTARALEAVTDTAAGLTFNPGEKLLLQSLLIRLG
jgi:DNA polymerase-3 subunit delta'